MASNTSGHAMGLVAWDGVIFHPQVKRADGLAGITK